MKNKGMFVILLLLFIIALGGGVVGFLQSKKNTPTNPNDNPTEEAKITYKYYVEDEEVAQMPENLTSTDENGVEQTNVLYVFSKLSCTNNVTGEFNSDTWTFTPSTTDVASVCSLYFVNSKYEVTLTVTNGEPSADNLKYVDREKDGSFVITPTAGYEFDSAVCSDSKVATWNPKNNTLNISAVMKDVACKVVFKIKTLTLTVSVINGTGDGNETAQYGDPIETIVTPKTGFEKPTIKCTNNQVATFADNKLSIAKLTDNTTCKVTFNAVAVKKYTLKVTAPTIISITSGGESQQITSGSSGTFTLKPDEGYSINTFTCTNSIVPSKQENSDGSTTYTFNSVTSNITCTATAIAN